MRMRTPSAIAFVLVSEPPMNMLIIISACSSPSVSVRPHSGISVLTRSEKTVSLGSARSRSNTPLR